jgi:nicotinamidase/pyrazinamidase
METLNPTRNILVAVDVQNDFIDGSLAVNEGEAVVAPLNTIADAIRETGGQVAFTRDWHPPTTPHFDTWPVHCVAETDGAEFHPELNIQPEDIVVSKGEGQTDGYSGWEGASETGVTLETLIAPQGPGEKIRVFIGGLATDYCVKATGLDIAERFKNDERVTLYLIRDAIRAVGIQPTDESAALQALTDANIAAISSQEALEIIHGSVQ